MIDGLPPLFSSIKIVDEHDRCACSCDNRLHGAAAPASYGYRYVLLQCAQLAQISRSEYRTRSVVFRFGIVVARFEFSRRNWELTLHLPTVEAEVEIEVVTTTNTHITRNVAVVFLLTNCNKAQIRRLATNFSNTFATTSLTCHDFYPIWRWWGKMPHHV